MQTQGQHLVSEAEGTLCTCGKSTEQGQCNYYTAAALGSGAALASCCPLLKANEPTFTGGVKLLLQGCYIGLVLGQGQDHTCCADQLLLLKLSQACNMGPVLDGHTCCADLRAASASTAGTGCALVAAAFPLSGFSFTAGALLHMLASLLLPPLFFPAPAAMSAHTTHKQLAWP